MRKDVKLGFAVGGVLIAVLVVYVLVVSGESAKPPLTVADGVPGKKLDISADGKATDAKPAETKVADQAADAHPAPQKPSQPAQWDAPGPELARGTDAAVPAIPPASIADKTDKAEPSADAPPRTPVAAKGADMDWGKLLNSDHMPLIAETPMKVAAYEPSDSVTPLHPLPPSQGAEAAAPAPADTARADVPQKDAAVAAPLPDASSAPPRTESATQPAEPAAASPATAIPSGARTHVIREGETLSTISLAAYGSSSYYPHLLRANPNLNPNLMKVGTTINLPELPASKAVDASTAAVASNAIVASVTIDPMKQYKVQPGDSLYRISVKLYGRADRADKIHELNKQAIGDDPAKVKVGQLLTLPEPPTQTQPAAAH